MFETMASFMLVEHANGAMFDPPLGPAHYPRVVAPNRRPYRTSDGYISALIYNDKQWALFVDAVRPPWASDELATVEQRARQIDAVYGLLAGTFRERSTQEWLDLFRKLGIPAAPLRTPDELFENPHLNAIGFFETVESPHGPMRFPGVPTWFSRTRGRVAGPAPALGAKVLEGLGLPNPVRRRVRGVGMNLGLPVLSGDWDEDPSRGLPEREKRLDPLPITRRQPRRRAASSRSGAVVTLLDPVSVRSDSSKNKTRRGTL